MSQAKASGNTKSPDQMKVHLARSKVNIWIEKPGGEVISHAAFYAGLIPNGTCAVGAMGGLVVAEAWQGKRLASEGDLLVDLAYDLGYPAFHTTTKVTNLESLKTQRRSTLTFKLKKMGTVLGYLQAQEDMSETQPKGTIFVALVSPTGGWHSCPHHRLTKKYLSECGPVLMGKALRSGKFKEVNFTKADMLQQVELDPESPDRAMRVLTRQLNGVLDL
eukprot:TRINITY_DN2550_c0_g1_i6.p1 TRINITY_DN2550_c0_g1~~TRINITY_DN2550_c0_g1_i6.p1  ORF type:complete len:257 (-),score=16.10 TRINITY_DN2550_c0_g1_i6:37-693(-)